MIKQTLVAASLISCVFMTGCSGYASEADITEVRSLLEDLNLIDNQKIDAVIAPKSDQDVVTTPTAPAEPEEVAQEPEEPQEPEVVEEPTEEPEVVVNPSTPSTQTAQLSWEAPQFYEDGSVLSSRDISHYKMVWGTSKKKLTNAQDLDITGILTANFSAAKNQTWYVAMRTVSVDGSISNNSNIIAFNF